MTPGAAQKRRASYEDLLCVPAHLVAEIVDGDLYATPRPAVRHANAASVLIAEIVGPFHRGRGGPGGWWILSEPELHLHDDIVVPDLAGWRRSRLPALPDAAFLTLTPDWIAEILSPSTERLDRAKKLAVYAREGVSFAWLINPSTETLEVLALASGAWTLKATYAGSVAVHAEPFDAIELDLSALWATGASTQAGAASR